MRIAHLLLVHAEPAQVARLVARLRQPHADVFLHVDRKAPLAPFAAIAAQPGVFLVQKRVKVYWGAYSIVAATLNGFNEILAAEKKYDWINLLSGQDYPLQPLSAFHDFLQQHPGRAFMEYYPIATEWTEALPRIQEYHLTNYPLPGAYRLAQLISQWLPPRQMPHGWTAVGRSQWMTLPREHVAYLRQLLSHDHAVRRFFSLTWAPDEFIFQTILYNSLYRDRMVNDNLRYLEWPQGAASPKVLSGEDWPALAASGKFFARKMHPQTSAELLAQLDATVAPAME